MATEISSPDVVLLRSKRTPDPYVQAFGDVGFRAVCTPVLSFSFPHQEALRDRLRRPQAYNALVATSPRVGRALRRLFDDEGTLHDAWSGHRAFAVGPKTAEALRALSFQVEGDETGTGSALAALIADRVSEGRLLFLCGNRRREDVPTALENAGIDFDEQVVYETRARTVLTLPPPSGETWLAFFSPSGLDAVRAAGVDRLGDYRFAAIGPTTSAALEDAGIRPDAVAETPSPEGLVTAVLNARGAKATDEG